MVESTSMQTYLIIGVFTFFMLYFSYKDYMSYKNDKEQHRDYKSIIVSIGVLGTFTGIFIGLLDFNTSNIKESVPVLLEGLKTAFVTSIEGMFLSILLSGIQKSKGSGETEDKISILNAINNKLDKLNQIDEKLNFEESFKHLDTLPLINTKLDSIDNKLKQLETLPLVNTKLDSIDTNIKSLSNDISSVKEEMKSNQALLFDFLEKSLNNVNQSLEDAIDKLSEGATKEIITALENVIKDFNNNLTEQFGDNFKQLNESIKNLIVWQDNYKNSIIELEKTLNSSIESISSTDKKLVSMTENYEKIDNIHSKLQEVIQTNNNQINNIETHLKALNEVGEKAKLSVESIDEFSEKIQKSLSGQSEALSKLTQDIDKQLPDALDELNKALTTLTNKFKQDYEYFLEQISKLMATSNR